MYHTNIITTAVRDKESVTKCVEPSVSMPDNKNSLKCHRCSVGYLSLPIRICKKDHLLCEKCSPNPHCPLCNNKLHKSRGLNPELSRQLTSCPNPQCRFLVPFNEISLHQEQCEFQEMHCGALLGTGGCSWSGSIPNVTSHFLSQHKDISVNKFMHDFMIKRFSEVEQYSASVLLACFNQLFLVRLDYDKADETLYGKVQFVSGTQVAAREFRFEVEVAKMSENGQSHSKMCFSRQTYKITDDVRTGHKCDCFTLHKKVGELFTDNSDSLTVTVVVRNVQSLAAKSLLTLRSYSNVPSQYCQRCVNSFDCDG